MDEHLAKATHAARARRCPDPLLQGLTRAFRGGVASRRHVVPDGCDGDRHLPRCGRRGHGGPPDRRPGERDRRRRWSPLRPYVHRFFPAWSNSRWIEWHAATTRRACPESARPNRMTVIGLKERAIVVHAFAANAGPTWDWASRVAIRVVQRCYLGLIARIFLQVGGRRGQAQHRNLSDLDRAPVVGGSKTNRNLLASIEHFEDSAGFVRPQAGDGSTTVGSEDDPMRWHRHGKGILVGVGLVGGP